MSRRVSIRLIFTFAVLYTVSLARFSWWIFSFVALFPLLDGIHRSRSVREAFQFSYWSGFAFLLFSLLWVRHVTTAGLVVFALFDALAIGAFGALVKILFQSLTVIPAQAGIQSNRPPLSRGRHPNLKTLHVVVLFFGIPSLWVAQEFLRVNVPVLGFGFNLLGHSQAAFPMFAQAARLVGDYGLSFLVALPSASLFLGVVNFEAPEKPKLSTGQRFTVALSIIFIFSAVLAYGTNRLNQPPSGDTIRIAVIQGNIPQPDKWDLATKPLIIEKYKKLSQLAKYDGPELMVWPEASWPGDFSREFGWSFFQEFIDELGFPMVIGSVREEKTDEYYNSALLVEPKKGITDHYDKVNLVPFGEFVPFGKLFRLFGVEQYARAMGVSDFSFGKDPAKLFELKTGSAFGFVRETNPKTALDFAGLQNRGAEIASAPAEPRNDVIARSAIGATKQSHKFASLICFEDSFSNFVRKLVDHGAEFLLVITNDAWFEYSAGPYQHLQCSVMRAIENGTYVVRAANTGVSAFINPHGIVEDRVADAEGSDIFVTGGLTRPVFVASEATPFRRFGYLFPYLCILLVLVVFAPVIYCKRS